MKCTRVNPGRIYSEKKMSEQRIRISLKQWHDQLEEDLQKGVSDDIICSVSNKGEITFRQSVWEPHNIYLSDTAIKKYKSGATKLHIPVPTYYINKPPDMTLKIWDGSHHVCIASSHFISWANQISNTVQKELCDGFTCRVYGNNLIIEEGTEIHFVTNFHPEVFSANIGEYLISENSLSWDILIPKQFIRK